MAVLQLESQWRAHDFHTVLPLTKLPNVGRVKRGRGKKIKTIVEESQNYAYISHFNGTTFLKTCARKKKKKNEFFNIKNNLSITESR